MTSGPTGPTTARHLSAAEAWALLLASARQPPGEVSGAAADTVRSPGGATLSLRAGVGSVRPEPDSSARELLEMWLPVVADPYTVLGQVGQSLDGRVATESGHSHFVTGPEDIHRLHRARALVDAVVVGAGTVTSDDPRLTVRHVEGPSPARVVLDPRGRVDPEHTLFHDQAAPTLWIRAGSRPRGLAPHVEIAAPPEPGRDGRVDPVAILEMLRARGWRRVLVEGGGITVSRFLEAGALTRLHVTVAPLVIGSGRHGLSLPPVRTLEEALRPPCRQFRLGEDVLFDLDLSSGAAPATGS